MKEAELLKKFENRTLPKPHWTHQSHLIVALWYCIQYDSDRALELLREKIKSYNDAVGTPNTDNGGYHETLTRFWIWQTNQFLESSELFDFSELCLEFISSELGLKDAPFKYYTSELLFSIQARKGWIEPDLKPISLSPKRYMIIERFHPHKVKELYSRFNEKGRMLPEGVKYVDSWIDENVKICYQLMESKSIEKLKEWISYWSDLADFEITPIVSSIMAKRKTFIINI